MKSIFLNRYFHPDTSATSQLLTDLAFRLASDGHEVHVITSRQRYDNPGARLPSSEKTQGVAVHRVWTTTFGRSNLLGRAMDYLSFYVGAAVALWRIARRGDAVVAETDPPLISWVAASIARLRGAVLVNWLQDIFPDVAERLGVRPGGSLGDSIAGRMRDHSLRRAIMNVALGERMAATVVGHVPEARVTVIHNWADGSRLQPIPRDANALRNEWGLGDRFVVGYSGNMGRAHEFETVIGACELLRDDDTVAFLFTGSGQQRQWIEDEARKRSLRRIHFQPHQAREALGRSLSVADAHLITLKPELEGLIVPSKFYGIAAVGRPSIFIGDPKGEIATLLERHRCGFTVASGDAKGVAAAITTLARDPSTCTAMGSRARSAFETHFDIGIAYAQWKQLLSTLRAAA